MQRSNGFARLIEQGSLNAQLEQTFVIPSGTESLQVLVDQALLGANAINPDDVFEIALLDASTSVSLVEMVTGLSNSDAFFNLQANGQHFTGSDTTVVGDPSTNDSFVVELDLSGVPADTVATLYFTLIGFDASDSQVGISDVSLQRRHSTVTRLRPRPRQ